MISEKLIHEVITSDAFVIEDIRIPTYGTSNLKRDSLIQPRNLLVVNGKIQGYINRDYDRNLRKINMDAYCIHPFRSMVTRRESRVANHLDGSISSFFTSYAAFLFVPFDISRWYFLQEEYRKMRKKLLNESFDYVFIPQIDFDQLNVSFIKEIKKNKIQMIMVELDQSSSIDQVPWGWIRNELDEQKMIILPKIKDCSRKIEKSILKQWNQIQCGSNVKFFQQPLREEEMIDFNQFSILRSYSFHLELQIGNKASLMVFEEGNCPCNVDFQGKPSFTIIENKLIQYKDQFYLYPGRGKNYTSVIQQWVRFF